MVRNIEYKFDSYKESHGRNDGVRVSQGVPKKLKSWWCGATLNKAQADHHSL